MMVEEEVAWVVKEFSDGRMQTDLARALGYTAPTICQQIKNFCDRWSGVDVSARMAYGDERRRYARVAIVNYSKQRTRIRKPPPHMSSYVDQQYAVAINELAWTLRLEGMTYVAIGERLGVSTARARQRVQKFGKRMAKAMRHARVTIYAKGEEPPVRDWLKVGTIKNV